MLPHDLERGLLFDLSDRAKLRLTGADRLRFVNGQITNDVRKASESAAVAACVLNAKGKLEAHIFASVRDDSILIDTDGTLREKLIARLDRYIIADEVQIDDVSERFRLFHVVAEVKPTASAKFVSATRFGTPGVDLWMDSMQPNDAAAELSATFPLCDEPCADQFRIEQGMPRWGRELTEDIIPVEANLEESCIDYAKGCYIGQEVISRMKMSGQRNKGLYGLVAKEDNVLAAGMKLFSSDDQKKEAGWLTSVTWSVRLGRHIALGYVKRPFNQPGSELNAVRADDAVVPVKIVGLPFRAEAR